MIAIWVFLCATDFLTELKITKLRFIRKGGWNEIFWFSFSSQFAPWYCGYKSDDGYENQSLSPRFSASERRVRRWWLFHDLCRRRASLCRTLWGWVTSEAIHRAVTSVRQPFLRTWILATNLLHTDVRYRCYPRYWPELVPLTLWSW